MNHDWSPQQVAALKSVEEWFFDENSQQVFKLFGFAGTGKTTLAIHIARIIRKRFEENEERVKKQVLFAAFTGKASLVMRSKGCTGASTIHSLIYSPDADSGENPSFSLNPDSDLEDASLCIIDECSMVGAELAADLLSFEKKVLVLGDPAQLPPVKDAGFFTNGKPDIMLTEVHRQAAGNPIIKASMDIRAGVRLQVGDYGPLKIVTRAQITPDTILAADQVLVGKNDTRSRYNARIRELRNFKSDLPMAGEKLVCLRNNRIKGLLNGGLWTVEKRLKCNVEAIRLVVKPEDAAGDMPGKKVKIHPVVLKDDGTKLDWDKRKETDEFTYGYALTVHKSQGSQWPNVVLFDESGVFQDNARKWLYTGVTRAADQLVVVVPS